MTMRGLIEAVGLALMKAGAWLHRRGGGGHLYERDKTTWRFVAGSDPDAILRAWQDDAILRALEADQRKNEG